MHEGNRALRVANWKIVAAGAKSEWELYDLSTDRAESNNLAAAEPNRVRDMAQIWTQQLDDCRKLAEQDLP
jgi:arylsulfatase